jgi:N-acetylmuramoyl-L-alanine amidase
VLGQILLVVIAIAVTVATKGATAKFFAGVFQALGASATAATAAATVASAATAAAAGSIVSQTVGVATGIQEKFSWKDVGLAAISAGLGAGSVSSGNWIKDAARAMMRSAVTQGIGAVTGLQTTFNWAAVAAAGVGSAAGSMVGGFAGKAGGAVSGAVGGKLGDRLGRVTTGAITGMADSIGNAATMSLIEGTDFGDNVRASLPSVLGNAIASGIGLGSSGEGEGGSNWLDRISDGLVDSVAGAGRRVGGAVRRFVGSAADQTAVFVNPNLMRNVDLGFSKDSIFTWDIDMATAVPSARESANAAMSSQFRYTEDVNGGQGAFRRLGLPYMEDGEPNFRQSDGVGGLGHYLQTLGIIHEPARSAEDIRAERYYGQLESPDPNVLNLVSASQWKRFPPDFKDLTKRENLMSIRNVAEIVVHHTGRRDTPQEVEGLHRGLDNPFSPKGYPWSDVGYHFMIAADGTIYAGRNLAFKGAHVRGHNENTIGIAFLGDYSNRPVSARALAAFRSLQSSLEQMSGNRMMLSTHGYYDAEKRSEMMGAVQQLSGIKAPTILPRPPRPLPPPSLPLNRMATPKPKY